MVFKNMIKNKKIIVIVLGIVFLVFCVSTIYNLYGKKFINNNAKPTTNNLETSSIDNKKINNEQKEGKPAINKNTQTDSNIAYSSYSICLENTKNGPDAKDCCDCLDADLSIRKACRDATVNYDFSKNTSFKIFEIPSTLGINGDYSSYTASGNQLECKQACEAITTTIVCGDFQYCRTACDNLD